MMDKQEIESKTQQNHFISQSEARKGWLSFILKLIRYAFWGYFIWVFHPQFAHIFDGMVEDGSTMQLENISLYSWVKLGRVNVKGIGCLTLFFAIFAIISAVLWRGAKTGINGLNKLSKKWEAS